MVKQSRLVPDDSSGKLLLVNQSDLVVSRILGRGSFSDVHEVRVVQHHADCCGDPHRRYAMKHLKAKLLREQGGGDNRFQKEAVQLAVEAHLLASFDHPNVLKIRGWAAGGVASYADGRHDSFFLLLDRLDETLDQRLARWPTKKQQSQPPHSPGNHGFASLSRRFSVSSAAAEDPATVHKHAILQKEQERAAEEQRLLYLEKVGICGELASALAYVHSRGVIFRDLKPNNIGFLHGRVQLFDFGHARELPALNLEEKFEMSGPCVSSILLAAPGMHRHYARTTSAHNFPFPFVCLLLSLQGTLRYMAPEVGRRQAYNVSADVYSWAMVCYEVLVEKPFEDWNRSMLEKRVWGCGERPATHQLLSPNTIRPLLEAGWDQHAHQRPAMRVVEERMKQHLTELQRHCWNWPARSAAVYSGRSIMPQQQQVTMEQLSCNNSPVSYPNNNNNNTTPQMMMM